MGISRFFIDRPVFAWVIAIVVMLVGTLAIFTLPIAQYPDIAPPTITVQATDPGASAEAVETSVTQVIEQQLTGIDHLLYFASSSDGSGAASIQATFDRGTDPDVAQVQVQNKVQQALSRLPAAVQQQGVTVTKASGDNLLVMSLYDTSDRATDSDIADYLVSHFQDDIARVNGVGQVQTFGSQYAIRIWLDPARLAARQLMPSDIAAAVTAQNVDLSAGQVGAAPAVSGQMLNAVVKVKSRLQTPEQFAQIVVKTLSDGSVVRLSDVARVEMGQEDYTSLSHLNGHPASGMAVRLTSGADALKTAAAVKARIAELARNLPSGYAIAFPMDASDFIKLSIREVVTTLLIAVGLVVIVMYIFLQSWRATLVPAVSVPVVLLGTFGVLSAFGYSINTMTLFGMVLAIGLLVDDAIVVVENVERIMAEEGLGPREATVKSMGEIGAALIGVAVVLSAVMLPMAFFGGSTGVIYRQFSVTVVSAMALSVGVALILSPALCATLLKPGAHQPAARSGWLGGFNRGFEAMVDKYLGATRSVIGHRRLYLLVYGAVVVGMVLLFVKLPTGFLPEEDQGQMMVQFTLPAGATTQRAENARRAIEAYFFKNEPVNVPVTFSISGFSFSGAGQNAGMSFMSLAPYNKRPGERNTVEQIVQRANKVLSKIRDAHVNAVVPPSIHGLGQSNGFTFELLNTSGLPRSQFVALRDALVDAAKKDPKLSQVRAATLPDSAQLQVHFDDAKLAVLGVSESDATDTLGSAWGGTYIDDFVDRGRIKRVYMQADAPYRMLPQDIDKWFVRSSGTSAGTAAMVPVSSFATADWAFGANSVSRFNGQSSYEIDGEQAPGYSSGDAMNEMLALQEKLAPGTGYAWSGLSFQERQSNSQSLYLYSLSIIVVFLCLAALYESWSVPLAVILVIPLGVVGAVLAVSLRGLENDIYFQVGLLTTIGLVSKNAILIIEFAETARRGGKDIVAATLEAARIRLRPILMTSIAFMAGVFPLAIATGAGAHSRMAIGTAVLGGMLSATALAVFFVPLFFVVVAGTFYARRQPVIAAQGESL